MRAIIRVQLVKTALGHAFKPVRLEAGKILPASRAYLRTLKPANDNNGGPKNVA